MPAASTHPLLQTEFVPDELHLRVFMTRFIRIDRSWTAKDVYSSFWRLYVNNRDGAAVDWAGGRFELQGRRVHIVPAWVRFNCVNTRPVDHCYIHFDLIGLPATLVRELFDHPLTLPHDRYLDALVWRWVSLMSAQPPVDLAVMCDVKSLTYLAVASLLRTLSPEEQARCFRHLLGQHPVVPAVEHIDAHPEEPAGNEKLAQLCDLSTDHFIRLFRESIGQTPAQYALDRRVSMAAQRLVFGAGSIEQIAEETGFKNRFYFSRVFNQRMGLPPAAYRRAGRV